MICASRQYGLRSQGSTGRSSGSSHNDRNWPEKLRRSRVHTGIPIHDENRAADVLGAAFEQAVECKIDPVSVQKIFETLIAMSEDRQRECSGEGNLP